MHVFVVFLVFRDSIANFLLIMLICLHFAPPPPPWKIKNVKWHRKSGRFDTSGSLIALFVSKVFRFFVTYFYPHICWPPSSSWHNMWTAPISRRQCMKRNERKKLNFSKGWSYQGARDKGWQFVGLCNSPINIISTQRWWWYSNSWIHMRRVTMTIRMKVILHQFGICYNINVFHHIFGCLMFFTMCWSFLPNI